MAKHVNVIKGVLLFLFILCFTGVFVGTVNSLAQDSLGQEGEPVAQISQGFELTKRPPSMVKPEGGPIPTQPSDGQTLDTAPKVPKPPVDQEQAPD